MYLLSLLSPWTPLFANCNKVSYSVYSRGAGSVEKQGIRACPSMTPLIQHSLTHTPHMYTHTRTHACTHTPQPVASWARRLRQGDCLPKPRLVCVHWGVKPYLTLSELSFTPSSALWSRNVIWRISGPLHSAVWWTKQRGCEGSIKICLLMSLGQEKCCSYRLYELVSGTQIRESSLNTVCSFLARINWETRPESLWWTVKKNVCWTNCKNYLGNFSIRYFHLCNESSSRGESN